MCTLGLISSNPTPWMTTAWSTLPTSFKVSAINSNSSSWKTPITA
ncbi:hypothetical protein ACHAXS_007123, partial [Conticribra weissflogii]